MAWYWLDRGFFVPLDSRYVDWCRANGIEVMERRPRKPDPLPDRERIARNTNLKRKHRQRVEEMNKDLRG